MAFRPILRQRAAIPAAAASILFASTILYPKTTLHAEAPQNSHLTRKPIYDTLPTLPPKPTSNPSTPGSSSTSPTPTDRLATQIRHARLFLHAQTSAAETRLNTLLSSLLHLENNFTSTIASLAPAPETHERLMPGALYVLVSAMAGSIVTRNRNILLRASVPVAVGIGAGWVVLPYTMANVAELVWGFEKRVPVVAENHLRVRGAVEEGWKQATVHGELAGRWSEEMVREAREAVEGWVRKGR